MSERILEPEVMASLEEAAEYDKITRKFLHIVHDGAVERALNLGPEKGSYLDIGTGTGWIAIQLARFNPDIRIHAVDLSESMLSIARANAEREGVADRIIFTIGDAKKLEVPDSSVDMVISHNMLHHVAEPFDLVREVRRVLKPGGGVLLRDLLRPPTWQIPLHLRIIGFRQSPLMRKEYTDSLHAALSLKEWQDLLRASPLSGLSLRRHFLTHMSLERSAINRRSLPLRLPAPLLIRRLRAFYSAGVRLS
jgi:ubiquinone/menaquinone biosynthesis C-methylase UbiE